MKRNFCWRMKRKFLFIDYDYLIKNLTRKTQWDKPLLRKKEYSQENLQTLNKKAKEKIVQLLQTKLKRKKKKEKCSITLHSITSNRIGSLRNIQV